MDQVYRPLNLIVRSSTRSPSPSPRLRERSAFCLDPSTFVGAQPLLSFHKAAPCTKPSRFWSFFGHGVAGRGPLTAISGFGFLHRQSPIFSSPRSGIILSTLSPRHNDSG